MKLHHWFITGILALLTAGCATTDTQRDDGQPSDSAAVAGLWLVVDNGEPYELDEKAVKLTLSPGQHRIDLVEDLGASPIDSYCTSSNASIEATVTVFLRMLRIDTNRGITVETGGVAERNGTSIYPCSSQGMPAQDSSEPVVMQNDVKMAEDKPCATPNVYVSGNSSVVGTRGSITICGRYTFTPGMLNLFDDEIETNQLVDKIFNDREAYHRSRISACIQNLAHTLDDLRAIAMLVKKLACYDGPVSAL